MQVLLASPNMLYRTELGAVRERLRELDDFEIASALSYTFWDSPPDTQLHDLAVAGALRNSDTLASEAERLATDPRYINALTEFYADYLKLDNLFGKEKVVALGLTNPVREDLVAGAREDIRDAFRKSGATLFDPLALTSFHMNSITAPYFGETSAAVNPEVQAANPAQRYGMLTHPAFLSVHSGQLESGIVKRGVFTLQQLLCFTLGPPPDNVAPVTTPPAGFDADKVTSREELYVLHTSQAACVGCHTVIDPAGYGYENYDAAGRYRTTEKDNITINAAGTLPVGREELVFNDGVGYAKAIAQSETFRSCLADRYLAYVLGAPAGRDEAAAFEAGFTSVNADIQEIARLIVASPSFTTREPIGDDQ